MNQTENHCDTESGKLVPVINLNVCEGKRDCLEVCPYDVFEIRPISTEEKKQLSLIGKLKTFFHPEKAYVKDPDLCHACGKCVPACPEKAIKLQKR